MAGKKHSFPCMLLLLNLMEAIKRTAYFGSWFLMGQVWCQEPEAACQMVPPGRLQRVRLLLNSLSLLGPHGTVAVTFRASLLISMNPV